MPKLTYKEAVATVENADDIAKAILTSGLENATDIAHSVKRMAEGVESLGEIYNETVTTHQTEVEGITNELNKQKSTSVKLYEELYLKESTKTPEQQAKEIQDGTSKKNPFEILVETGKTIKDK